MENWDLPEAVENTEDFKMPPDPDGSNSDVLGMTRTFLAEEAAALAKERERERPRNFSMDMTSNPEVWEKGAQGYNPSLANEYDLRQSPVSFPEAQDEITDGNLLSSMGEGDFAKMPQGTKETKNTFKKATQNYDSNFLPIPGKALSPIVKKAAKASANRRKRGTKRKRGGRRSRKKRTKRRKRKSRRKRTKRRKRKSRRKRTKRRKRKSRRKR